MELTQKNINSLIEWQKGGDRSIKIGIDNPERLIFEDEPIKIWVYDYAYGTGNFVSELLDLPTEASMKQELIDRKKKEIQELEDRLNGLKEVA